MYLHICAMMFSAKKSLKILVFCFCLFFISVDTDAQGLENIIVENYHTSNANDVGDTTIGILPEGSITYRIFVDMKPGYSLQAIYGVPDHELRIETTTSFFNHKDGAKNGDQINDKKINDNTMALDSWLSMGAATKFHYGILKSEDPDGSILRRASLEKSDGLISGKENPQNIIVFGLFNTSCFENEGTGSVFSTNNGSLASLGGVKGPLADSNRVLIAQLTTNGTLSFEINIQLGTPSGETEQYVAKNPEGSEIKFDGLVY